MKLIRIIGSQIPTKIKILLFITFCLIIVTIGLGISSAVLHSQYKNTTREEEKERKRKYRNRLAIATFVFLGVLVTLIIVSLQVLQRSTVTLRQDVHSSHYNKRYSYEEDEEDDIEEEEDDEEAHALAREEAHTLAHALAREEAREVEVDTPNLSGDSEEIGDTTSEVRSEGPEKKTVIINEKSVDLLKVRCIKEDSVKEIETNIIVYSAPNGYKNYEVKLPLEKDTNKKEKGYRVTEKDKKCKPTKGILIAGSIKNGINIPILVKETGDQEKMFIPKVEALGKKEIDEEKDLIQLITKDYRNEINIYYKATLGLDFSDKSVIAANIIKKLEFEKLFSQNNSNLEIIHEGV